MTIAALYNVPSNPQEFAEWSFAHQAHHVDLAAQMLKQANVVIPGYILDPFDPNDVGVWVYQHQLLHDQISSTLRTENFDLIDVEMTNPDQLASWIWLNANLHQQAGDILGVG